MIVITSNNNHNLVHERTIHPVAGMFSITQMTKYFMFQKFNAYVTVLVDGKIGKSKGKPRESLVLTSDCKGFL